MLRIACVAACCLSASLVAAADYTNGPGGINATSTGLDGLGVDIGQVEGGRPGVNGYDNMIFSASNTTPTAVYDGATGGMSAVNALTITEHATRVAGLMIGDLDPDFGDSWIGTAPAASLHASATNGGIAEALNRIATLNGGNNNGTVRAINMSFGIDLQPFCRNDRWQLPPGSVRGLVSLPA